MVVSSLSKGGAERSAALISIMLSDLGYDVHIVSVLNHIDYVFKGTLLNLGLLKDEDDSFFGRITRFKAFKNYLKTHNFNVIIDSRSRPNAIKELLIQRLIYKKQKVVYIIHSYKTSTYLPNKKWFYRLFFNKLSKVITVSNAIKIKIEEFYNIQNVTTIYNAVDNENNVAKAKAKIDIDYKYILFYGRLIDEIKNISLLINAYRNSKLNSKNIKLIILGNGVDELVLKQKVRFYELEEFVKFIPYTHNPFPYIKHATFTVLTSRYEGFPMVIPEALSLETPVISVDCLSGPNEVIVNKKNGLLVENYNEKALTEAMNSFIFDEELYDTCKKNAKASVEKFSLKNIAEDWETLLNEIN